MTAYRDRKRQEAWVKLEAKRAVAREQAERLTALGVPAAQRDAWVVLLAPDDLAIRLGGDDRGNPCPCPWCTVSHWERELLGQERPQPPAAGPTLPADGLSASPEGNHPSGPDAAEGRREREAGGLVGKGVMFRPDPSFIASPRALDRLLDEARPGGYTATQWPSEGEQG